MERALNIALLARRFALLARRREFLAVNPEHRVSHALTEDAPGPLHLLDAAQTIGASELDRLCAHAVLLLDSPGRPSAALLDVLGVLDPDRICAIYFALPPERRAGVLRDPCWAHHVQQVERDMPAAIAEVEELVAETPTSNLGYELARADMAGYRASGPRSTTPSPEARLT